MPLDPQVAEYLARVAADVPPLASPTPEARRTRMELVVRRFPAPEDADRARRRVDRAARREIAVRLYRPRSGKLPAILYLHGGGWVAGSLATHDGPCAALASDADALVAACTTGARRKVRTRAPNDDAYAALAWLARHADALDVDCRPHRARRRQRGRASRAVVRDRGARARAGRASRSSCSSTRRSSRISTRARTASTQCRPRSRATT
jgi:acetyl esterase